MLISTYLAALAVEQISIKVISLQWIFSFVIFGVFLAGSIYVSAAAYSGRDIFFKRIVHPEATDREREPLLSN